MLLTCLHLQTGAMTFMSPSTDWWVVAIHYMHYFWKNGVSLDSHTLIL